MPVSDWDLAVERSETLTFVKCEFRTRADHDKLLWEWEKEKARGRHPLQGDWRSQTGEPTAGAGRGGLRTDGRELGVPAAPEPGSCPAR